MYVCLGECILDYNVKYPTMSHTGKFETTGLEQGSNRVPMG